MRSERKMLPIGVENFEKIRRNDMYYVDKTEIIADLLRNHGDANLFTRPRRFGKTWHLNFYIWSVLYISTHENWTEQEFDNMPKSENQKQKLLYLLKFFYEETDEDHPLTVN